jgi:hypothetical protein
MAMLKFAALVVLSLVLAHVCVAQQEPILYCDTCKGMIDEINWAMDQGMSRNPLHAIRTLPFDPTDPAQRTPRPVLTSALFVWTTHLRTSAKSL